MALVRSEMQLVERRFFTPPEAAARPVTANDACSVKDLPFSTSTVGGYLLWRLYQLGVDHVFGVPGDFALGLLDLVAKSPLKYVGTCNELNAGYAADGYARIRGVGVCLVTYAVGELSALNAIAGSLSERVPTVIIVGLPPTSAFATKQLLHHTMGDYDVPQRIFANITCAQAVLSEPARAPELIDRALADCIFFHKPVYIGVPTDVSFQPCRTLNGGFPLRRPLETARPTLAEAVVEAAEMINKARRPVIVIDAMVRRCRLEHELLALIESCGIPFVSMTMGKALLSERHPLFLGLYAGQHSRPAVRQRVEEADCVVMFGPVLTDFNTGGFTAKLDTGHLISVSDDHVCIKYHKYQQIAMHDFVQSLGSRLLRRHQDDIYLTPASLACVHRPTNWDESSSLSHAQTVPMRARRFFDYMSKVMPENSVVIADVGECLFSLAETLLPEGATFISQTFYGSIGYTVGATLGVCAALENGPPRPVFLFIGDGSLQMTCQDLSTIIRNNFTPFVFVLNNNGYSIERAILDGDFNSIAPWKYHLLPLVFGGLAGAEVYSENDLQRAVAAAFDRWHSSMHMIEVHVPEDDRSESLTAAGRGMAEATCVRRKV